MRRYHGYTVADYVKAKKSPQEQMELLMATLLSCQRKIAMLTERRSTRTKGRGGGGGGRPRYHGGRNKRSNFDDYRHDQDGKEAKRMVVEPIAEAVQAAGVGENAEDKAMKRKSL